MPRPGRGSAQDYAQIGDMEKSAAAYARSIALQPGLPGIHMSYAHALKSLGQQPEALREYRAAIALKPEFGEVYWSMANLKVFRFEPAEVAAMEEQLKREDLTESADVHFRFALGKAYEDAGDYDRAWEHYHAATSASGRSCPTTRWASRPATRRSRKSSAANSSSSTRARDSSRTRRSSSSGCRARARR